jgi:SAM-dependent methyltransferase
MAHNVITTIILQKILQWLPSGLRNYFYWKIRVLRFGKRSVLNLAHQDDEYETITLFQKNEIFPHILKNLSGNEKVCLDFGCGPGRFSQDLANLINGKVIGVDPIRELIDLAPKSNTVDYRVLRRGKIPLYDSSVDMVWCCLVLGGIPDSSLASTIQEIVRVLRNGGLFILVENTASKTTSDYWTFRSVNDYCTMFPSVNLKNVHNYQDCEQTVSIMIGRKQR